MGSFNVACSISNLSIGWNDPLAFIPLWPNVYPKDATPLLPADPTLTYVNCLYNPVCLPIFGIYDGYGGVDDIVEDENVKLVEKFFNMNVHDFVKYITNGRRDIDDVYGSPTKFFAEPKKLKYVADYGKYYQFGKRWLKKMGFLQAGENVNRFYWPEMKNFTVSIYPAKRQDLKAGKVVKTHRHPSFVIYKDDIEVARGGYYYPRKDFVKEWHKLTGIIIYAEEKHWAKIEMLNRMSGMFVHRNIYEALINGADKMKLWWTDSRKPEALYDQFQENVKKWKEYIAKKSEDPVWKFLGKHIIGSSNLLLHFREWPFFKEIYMEALKNGKLKKEIIDWITFSCGMNSCNRFFFSGMNGEQYGNPAASRYLLEMSLKILENANKKKNRE